MPSNRFNTLRWPVAKYSKFSMNQILTMQVTSSSPGDLSIELHLSARRLVVRHCKAVIEEVSLQGLKLPTIRYKAIDVVFDQTQSKGTKFRIKMGQTGGIPPINHLSDLIEQLGHFVNIIQVADSPGTLGSQERLSMSPAGPYSNSKLSQDSPMTNSFNQSPIRCAADYASIDSAKRVLSFKNGNHKERLETYLSARCHSTSNGSEEHGPRSSSMFIPPSPGVRPYEEGGRGSGSSAFNPPVVRLSKPWNRNNSFEDQLVPLDSSSPILTSSPLHMNESSPPVNEFSCSQILDFNTSFSQDVLNTSETFSLSQDVEGDSQPTHKFDQASQVSQDILEKACQTCMWGYEEASLDENVIEGMINEAMLDETFPAFTRSVYSIMKKKKKLNRK